VSDARNPVTSDAAAFASARAEDPRPTLSARPSTDAPTSTSPRAKARSEVRRLVPAASCFDLLEGEYAKSRSSRLLSLTVLGVAGLAVVLLMGQFLRVRLDVTEQQAEQRRLLAQVTERQEQLNALSDYDGIPGSEISGFVQVRSSQAAASVETEIDAVGLVLAVERALPTGVELRKIVVEPPAPPKKGSKKNDAGGESEKTDGPSSVVVSLEAQSSSYDDIPALVAALATVPGFEDISPTWSGQVPSITVLVQATVPAGSSSRFTQFATDAGVIERSTDGG
jgi:hypothetical protein